ncbi:MAG UNVERIFIED_CONTAM: hypothetical protein LVR18_18305 [Planctomycetaceae bacterium]
MRCCRRAGCKAPADFSGAAAARSLDQSLNLTFTGNLHENFGKLGERWLKGGNSWYYITPAGSLFRWNNCAVTATAPLTGTLIASPGNPYYNDVSLLHAAEDPVLTVTSGSLVTRFDFGNYQPSIIEGRTWIDTDPNASRNPTRLPTAIAIPRPAQATVNTAAIAWYEVYAPVTDPLLATESDPPVRRIFYLTATGQVFRMDQRRTTASVYSGVHDHRFRRQRQFARAAFVAEPWQNGVTIQLLNASGYVVAQAVTSDVDRNADGKISSETEQGWYRFTWAASRPVLASPAAADRQCGRHRGAGCSSANSGAR